MERLNQKGRARLYPRCIRVAACTAIALGLSWAWPPLVDAQVATESPPRTLDPVRVEAFIDGVVKSSLRRDRIAGVSVAVVDRQGVVFAKGYGKSAPDRDADGDTLFRVGSISKIGAWIALMQLVEQGKLTLDDPINDHFPSTLQIPSDGFNEPIRVRHLLTHTAGFEDSVLGHLFPLDPNKLLNQTDYLLQYRVRRVRPPGEVAVYSNYGAGLAGVIVAHESGMDWPTYAEQRILRPLGMSSATYREHYSAEIAKSRGLPEPLSAEAAARVTQGWRWQGGKLVTTPYEYVSHTASAGSLAMSANDAAKYMQALLDTNVMANAGVLRADTLNTMRQPLFSNAEGLGEIRHGLLTFDEGGGRWGYGHTGGLVSHFSRFEVSPELGAGLFVSVNTQGGGGLNNRLARAFFDEFFPLPPLAEVPRPADAQAMAARYEGSYRVMRRAHRHTEGALMSLGVRDAKAASNGDLLVSMLGAAPTTRLIPIGNSVYQVEGEYARVAFKEVGDRILILDSGGVGPAERVGFFESLKWFAFIALLGAVIAVSGAIIAVRRVVRGLATRATLALDGLYLVWLVAIVFLGAAIASALSDPSFISSYPGTVLPMACWLLLVAAIASFIAPAFIWFPTRPRDWSVFRWFRVGFVIAVFIVLSITLWRFGLLGYSGW
jgi:CubicO group peptidase (beta-lactamase class C family)